MKTFKIDYWGNLPLYVGKIVNSLRGVNASAGYVSCLDADIEFCVKELREAHGNCNTRTKEAWLCPRNGDNSWNVRISWK